MVERKRVGLIFSYNENWIAGAYYIMNIAHALNTLNDLEKPRLIIFSESKATFLKLKAETNYPYLLFEKYPKQAKYSLLDRALNKLTLKLFSYKLINKKVNYKTVDFLYPKAVNAISKSIKKVNWIPDFQEDYLPQFFSKKELEHRKKHQKNVLAKSDVVVVSSEDAKNDFKRLYPESTSELFVLHFYVTHPDFSEESIDQLRVKYKLPTDYYFAPNQFWAHKNHIVILKAIKILKDQGIHVIIAMSGKENDYRNLDNFKILKNYMEENNLNENIKFLGFLPRKEQLCLFSNAKAIIQPSLFEGWSTVVEDAKALNKFLILSNLKVHKEQISDNVMFFNPNNAQELSEKLIAYQENPATIILKKYNENIVEFGKKINTLINNHS